ncbi:MAG: SpoIID/LytB domain-containing protein [Acidimicrobiales bacterium]
MAPAGVRRAMSPTPAGRSVPSRPPPPQPALQISGFGYGHGQGMGQWGAYGYASEYGWGYRQLLAHYYGGTTLVTLASPEPDIAVRLVEAGGQRLRASSTGPGGLVASWAGGRPVAAGAVEVERTRGVQVISVSSTCSGPWRKVATVPDAVTIAGARPGASPPAPAGIAASEVQACIPRLGRRTYQGELVSQPGGETDNIVGLEDYVEGVVAAEDPLSWASSGGEAALEAQAVAARSYALAVLAAAGPGSLCDDTACQMYLGLPSQYGPTADAAASATAGRVLVCAAGSTCGPAGTVALTQYSASTGGWSAGGLFPAVPDLGDSVAANPLHSWTKTVPVARAESELPSIGKLREVEVTKRNGLGQLGGRVEQVEVVGSAGTVSLSGQQFAADFSLRSDWFRIGAELHGPAAAAPATAGPPATSLPAAVALPTA